MSTFKRKKAPDMLFFPFLRQICYWRKHVNKKERETWGQLRLWEAAPPKFKGATLVVIPGKVGDVGFKLYNT